MLLESSAARRGAAFTLLECGFHNEILNIVSKWTPSDSEPDLHSTAFEHVNRRLRSMLAEHAVVHSARAGRPQKAIDIVCGDQERSQLSLVFAGVPQLSDVSSLAALRNLQNLEQLNLCFRSELGTIRLPASLTEYSALLGSEKKADSSALLEAYFGCIKGVFLKLRLTLRRFSRLQHYVIIFLCRSR